MAKRALMLLLKAFRQENWAEEFLDGYLYCNTLRFYREWEDERLRDEKEGVIVIPGAKIDNLRFGELEIPRGDLISLSYRPRMMDYVHTFCMYCWAPPWVSDKELFVDKETQLGSIRTLEAYNGPYTVVLRDTSEFFRRLTESVEHPDSKVHRAKGSVVKYEPMLSLPSTLEETLQAAFHKDSKYVGEQEFRLAFLLDHKQQGAFRLNVGSIRDIAVRIRTKDVYDSTSLNGSKDF